MKNMMSLLLGNDQSNECCVTRMPIGCESAKCAAVGSPSQYCTQVSSSEIVFTRPNTGLSM